MNIKSPFEGSLQDRYVEIGDFVKSGDNIATIIDDKTLIVKAEISENDVKFLKVGDLGLAKLSTGQEIQGIIRYIAPAAQESTRTFNIELKLKNDKGALRAGVSTQLIISAEEVTAHLVSPALLSLNDEGIIGIKIIEEKNKVKFIPADIVLASDEGVYIAGLPFTSTIITVGQGYVKSGMRVNLISESDTEATLAAQREKQGQ
jgi:multidrug efflux system membrane fusion protein